MASITHTLGSLVGHAALIGLLVLMGAKSGCTHKFPERLGGGGDGSEFTFVDLLPGEPPAPAPVPDVTPIPEPAPPKPTPTNVPDPDAVKLPEPEKKKTPTPKEPPKKEEPKKVEAKKPEPKKTEPVKKPPEPKKPVPPKPDPAKLKAEEAARKLEELRKKWSEADAKFTKTGGVTSPGVPGAGRGPGQGPGPGGPGSPDGSAAVTKVEDELYRKLFSVWDQPRGASTFLTTDVWIKLAPSGVILDKRVVKTSGDPEMDRTVLEAVTTTRAIGPLPRELRNGYETTFRFRVTN